MTPTTLPSSISVRDSLVDQRSRIVGLCATLVRDRDVAEDLAQETLYEAWKHQHELRDNDRAAQWLTGIARNVCLRWRQRTRWEAAHRSGPTNVSHAVGDEDAPASAALETLADEFDLERDLERRELATLLDQAVALLAPNTRTILIGRYIEQLTHAELAKRLGISEGALKLRLHRGRLALRRVLLDEFADTAEAYGLVPSATDTWEETRLWCISCGQHRLLGRLKRDKGPGEFSLRCPGCFGSKGLIYHDSDATLLGGVTRYKSAMARISTWANSYFREALHNGIVACRRCARTASLTIEPGGGLGYNSPGAPDPLDMRALVVTCGHCGLRNMQSHAGLILASAQGQAFWRAHPRIRLLPEREVEAYGRPALVTTFASITDGARFDTISACETFEVLSSHCTDTGLDAIESCN
jgi:RNA polymerase sigma-70 factor (ECF subfamily)